MYIVDFAKNLFRKANAGIIVYLVLNIVLYVGLLGGFSDGGMAAVGVMLYLVSLCVALSPIGEWILRLQSGCRKIKRQDYLNRLMPIFQEVYAQAKAKDPSISDAVQLYMCDDADPNAFATGRKTICLTKGFMSYTDAQIKGTLAHEFAHLSHKDTDLLLLITVGNFLMSAIFVIYRIIINFFIFIFASALRMRFIGTFLTSFFINVILTFLMWIWTKIGVMLVMHSSRKNEFNADQFAYELGYGNDLCVVLDSFESAGSGKKGLWSNLHSTHPDTSDRIANLQNLGAAYSNEYGHSVQSVNAAPQMYGYQHQTPPVLPPSGTGHNHPQPGYQHTPQPMGMAAFAPSGVAMQTPTSQYTQYVPPQAPVAPPAPVQPQYAQPPAQAPVAPPAPVQPQYAQPPAQAPVAPPAPVQPQYAQPPAQAPVAPPALVQPQYAQPPAQAPVAPPAPVQPQYAQPPAQAPVAPPAPAQPQYAQPPAQAPVAPPAPVQPQYAQPPAQAPVAPPAPVQPQYAQPPAQAPVAPPAPMAIPQQPPQAPR